MYCIADESEIVVWQQTYWDVMEALDAHRSFITVTLTRLAFCPILRTLGLGLKVCAVVVLTGTAALLSLFSADHPELRQKKYAAITEIISISSLFTDEDCQHLDPILSVRLRCSFLIERDCAERTQSCWTAIIGTMDQCISSGPEAVACSMHDLPAMADMIRKQNKVLQQIMPFAVDV